MTKEDNTLPRRGQVKEVTSLANPIIKDIKALGQKKHREETGLFIAEGLKLVIDALETGWHIDTLIYAQSAKDKPLVEKVAARTVASGGLVLEAKRRTTRGGDVATLSDDIVTVKGPSKPGDSGGAVLDARTRELVAIVSRGDYAHHFNGVAYGDVTIGARVDRCSVALDRALARAGEVPSSVSSR